MDRTWIEIAPIVGRRRKPVAEVTYKQITRMIDENFLAQGVRARALQGVKLAGIDDEKGEMTFFVRSSLWNQNSTVYGCTTRFADWQDVVNETDTKPIERARLLQFDGNLLLNCTCPSFLYHGYRYLLTQQDASLFPENRPPVRRNPRHRGIVCKHMNRVIKAFPFYSADLANHIKKYHETVPGEERAWDLKSKAAEVIKNDEAEETEATYEDLT